MNVRKSRSNSGPFAASNCISCSAVSMPGMRGACCIPGIMSCEAFASGVISRRSRSQRCMKAISSRWATTIRSHSARTASLAPWLGAQPAINTAWAWCPIMPCMKWTSAAV